MRNAARALVTLGFVGICAAIFYLTAQGPTESVALSSRFDAFLKSVVAHTGSDGLLAQLVQQIPVRRIGHTGEFFAFGALASVLVIVWFSQRMSVGTMMLASLGACMAGRFSTRRTSCSFRFGTSIGRISRSTPSDTLRPSSWSSPLTEWRKRWRGGGKARSRPQWRSASGRANIIL